MTTKTKHRAVESKNRKRKADDPPQYERFREAVRKHETDQNEEAFERTFRVVISRQSGTKGPS
jgi:hypothetical protein